MGRIRLRYVSINNRLCSLVSCSCRIYTSSTILTFCPDQVQDGHLHRLHGPKLPVAPQTLQRLLLLEAVRQNRAQQYISVDRQTISAQDRSISGFSSLLAPGAACQLFQFHLDPGSRQPGASHKESDFGHLAQLRRIVYRLLCLW